MSKTGFLVITRIVCIVLLLPFTIGCSKIRYFNNSNTAGLAAGLEKYEEHDNIGLEMADGSKYLASGVSVEADSLIWIGQYSRNMKKNNLSEIKRIVIKYPKRGCMVGGLSGCATGVLISLFAGMIAGVSVDEADMGDKGFDNFMLRSFGITAGATIIGMWAGRYGSIEYINRTDRMQQ